MNTFVIFAIHAALGIMLWLKMLAVLEKNGFKSGGPWVTLSDFYLFYSLAKNEPNKFLRKQYQFIIFGQLALAISCGIFLFR